MDDLRNFLAQNNAFGYASPAPQQTPMSSADRYAPGLMSSAPSMGGRAAPGVLGGMGAMPGQLLDSREWRGFGGGGGGSIPGSGRMFPNLPPGYGAGPREDAWWKGFQQNGPALAAGAPGVNQMAPGYDPQMGLQKAMQGLMGGMGPSSQGVSLGNLAGGNYGGGGFVRPGMGPVKARY